MFCRNVCYIAIIVLLALTAILLVTSRNRFVHRKQTDFALKDPSLVDKIEISNGNRHIWLEKDKDEWRLNGNYYADIKSVTIFLQTMGRIEVRSPASKSVRDSVVRRLEKQGIRLMLYHGNKIMKSILIGYENESIPGTYIMDERTRKPYLTGLTGYEGDNFEHLFDPGKSRWMSNILFDYSPADIALVQVEYPQHPERSFRIVHYPDQNPQLLRPDEAKSTDSVNILEINDYMSYFSAVPYTLPESHDYNPDQFVPPFAILTIIDNEQHIFSMKSYRLPSHDGTKYDINRYFAFIAADSLPVIVKYSDTDPIMKSYGDFIKK
ncbi:MAG: hypothetical protein JW973_04640 [Bacteroidales bacterium]|nr:hypothetical protein [Bacteroidales bacterium]